MSQNNDLDEINKNIAIKAYIVGTIPFLLITWFISNALDSSFIETILIIGGILLAWTIFRAIVTAITFRLFLKNDLIRMYVNMFRANNFPKPEEYHIESPEQYLRELANEADNFPQNVLATTMLCEFGHARTSGQMLVLFRLNKVMKEALIKYNH